MNPQLFPIWIPHLISAPPIQSDSPGKAPLSFVSPASSLLQEIESNLFSLTREGVQIPEHHEVREYLWAYPELLPVLPLAVAEVRKQFESPVLILSVYSDPEIEDRYLQLCIGVEEYDDGFLEKIEAAEEKIISMLSSSRGWLVLTTDFKKASVNAL